MAARSHKWRHEQIRTCFKNKVRLSCVCGDMSPVFEGEDRHEQADQWYLDHTKLVEAERRRNAFDR